MTIPLRVLILEDCPADAELMLSELRGAGFDPIWQRVDCDTDFQLCLELPWDIILADYGLPQLNATDALLAWQASDLDTPIIIVSGVVGEDVAVECMKLGAVDYVLKDRIVQLGPAVVNALDEYRLRREQQRADDETPQFFHATLNALAAHIAILDENGTIIAVNEAWRRFADENKLADPDYGVGTNYLALCLAMVGDEQANSTAVAMGIKRLLTGDDTSFRMEYPCHSPTDQRWFEVSLNGFWVNGARRIVMAHSNTTERKLAEQMLAQAVEDRTEQLRQSTERIESILNSSSDAILLVRRGGIIQQANPTFDEWFGGQGEDVFGRSLAALIEPDHITPLMMALDAVFDTHQAQRLEVTARREDGTLFDTDMVIFPALSGKERLTSVVCSMRDITQLKQAEQTLRQALAHEMDVSEMRMRFISMASHDLRNPLAIIRSGIDMLAEYQDRLSDEKKQKKFDQIRTSIFHMVELLDDVLIIGRVQAGKIRFKPELVDLETFCRRIIVEIETSIGGGHEFDFSIVGTSETRWLDPKLLRHMLYNLLSNAVKYSLQNSVVTLELTYESDRTVIRIVDEGIGIPEADLLRLFEAFHRAGNVGVRSGTGLGLAIVKQSVDLHGGSITCDTQETVGTTFTVNLPHVVDDVHSLRNAYESHTGN